MNYFLAFALAAMMSLVVTPYVRRLALSIGAVDQPGARKIHSKAVAYMGGLAIFIAFLGAVLVNLDLSRQLLGLLAGATILVIVGLVDDLHNLSPWHKLVWQVVAACAALTGGIGITTLTNPLGGIIMLNSWRIPVDTMGLHFHISPLANTLSIIWMVGMINVINFLDGLDGLACGVSGIAGVILFLVAVAPRVNQPLAAMLAIILAGACFGWLPFNFYPAKIFMGDSGAYFLGLTLALISIYSGAKLATAGLVLGFTIIDGLWTVARRLWNHSSPFKADRQHLHHLLLAAGLSQRQAVLGLYAFSLAFGLTALVSGSFAKLITLSVLVAVMVVLMVGLTIAARKRGKAEVAASE